MKKILTACIIITLMSCGFKEKRNTQSEYYSNYRKVLRKSIPIAKGWKYIVIHHSGTNYGSAKLFHKWHIDSGFGGLAYHVVIGNGNGAGNGEIQLGYRWFFQECGGHLSYSALYHNVFGIGICLVGDFYKRRPTRRQLASLILLLRYFSKKFNIPEQNIMGHKDVPCGEIVIKKHKIIFKPNGMKEDTTCPGRYFPMKYVKNVVFKNKIAKK